MLRPLLFAGSLLLAWRALASPVEFKLADAKGQPVADAVVSLVPLDAPVKPAPPAAPVEIVQKGQEFSPVVTPIVVGTTVSFPNQDTVQHHIYSLSKPKKFELPLYLPGKSARMVFDQPGIVVLGCNIHDWMSAYVVVLETPWFARTSADGRVTLAGAPPGRYRAEVWHARLAKMETREVTVSASDATPPLVFTLALKPDRRIRRTPEAAGGGYK